MGKVAEGGRASPGKKVRRKKSGSASNTYPAQGNPISCSPSDLKPLMVSLSLTRERARTCCSLTTFLNSSPPFIISSGGKRRNDVILKKNVRESHKISKINASSNLTTLSTVKKPCIPESKKDFGAHRSYSNFYLYNHFAYYPQWETCHWILSRLRLPATRLSATHNICASLTLLQIMFASATHVRCCDSNSLATAGNDVMGEVFACESINKLSYN